MDDSPVPDAHRGLDLAEVLAQAKQEVAYMSEDEC